MCSDNPDGAENQQERPISADWIVGFVDGEGCFSIGFVKQPDKADRRGYRAGYQVFHRFVVTQGERSMAALEEVQAFLGVGRICVNRRQDNHKEDLVQLIVGRRAELLETVIPFFQENPLRTAKRHDFEKFVRCMELVDQGSHLTRQGLITIAEIAQTMNHRKSRLELIGILRGHTPDTLRAG
jgi:hypothetical protein